MFSRACQGELGKRYKATYLGDLGAQALDETVQRTHRQQWPRGLYAQPQARHRHVLVPEYAVSY